jgi:hypothetical protein
MEARKPSRRCQLVGEALVLDKPILARRSDRLVGRRQRLRRDALTGTRPQLNDPEKAEHGGRPVPAQLLFENRLVELRVAEGQAIRIHSITGLSRRPSFE